MRTVIAGNWKMNHGPSATAAFFDRLDPGLSDLDVDLLVFPPALSFAAARSASPSFVSLGVQNVHFEPSGAFTGEVSAAMAREAGATYGLVGHSERRHVFGETDDDVARKAVACAREHVVPVVCVGETLEERRAGRVDQVIERQLMAALRPLSETGSHAHSEVIVAYEPVWAIGTGETATPGDASAAHRTLRALITTVFGPHGPSIPILYGGSVKPENAAELLSAEEVGGVLVGGASLDPHSFAEIARAAG